MSYYSNPTENAAIGAVDAELKMMRKKANRIRFLYRQGRLSQRELLQAQKEFTGIYRPLLQKALQS